MSFYKTNRDNKISNGFINQSLSSQNQDNCKKFDKKKHSDWFVPLINNLNDSIKEYYKVSRHNIIELTNIISYYSEQDKSIELLLSEIINTNKYEKMNELRDKINIIKGVLNQLKLNSNSARKNLDLFFEDVKVIFKNMQIKRKQSVSGLNQNSQNYSLLISNNDSICLTIKKIYSQINILLNKLNDFNNITNGAEGNNTENGKLNDFINIKNNIRKESDKLMNVINGIFNIDLFNNNNNKLNIYKNDINNIKRSKSQSRGINKEFEKLKNIIKTNEKKMKDLTNELNKYKKMQSIETLTPKEDSKNFFGDNNFKIFQLEQLLKEKDIIINALNKTQNYNNINSNNDLINIIKKKDSEISELKKELSEYKKNESLENTQIPELNNKLFKIKINQYENQINLMDNKIASLNRIIASKNNEIMKLQNVKKKMCLRLNKNNKSNLSNSDLKSNKTTDIGDEYSYSSKTLDNVRRKNNERKHLTLTNNDINHLNNTNLLDSHFTTENNIDTFNIDKENSTNEQKIKILNTKCIKAYKMIEVQRKKIGELNKEIINYKIKIQFNEERNNQYLKQIEEMNNNILNTNKIIEKKDEIIKEFTDKKKYLGQNNINKNEGGNSKSKIKENNDIKQLQQLNLKILSENSYFQEQIKKLREKNKELSALESPKLKEEIKKLELDINKKKDELEGLKAFIFKLQKQLENKDDNIAFLKKKSKELCDSSKDFNNENKTFLKRNNTNINNKSFDDSKDIKMKNILEKLNDANKKICELETSNKDLQFKLDEKIYKEEVQEFRTEDNNYSNYEEEFDLRKMISGAKKKNRSEDANIDYPGVQKLKDDYNEIKKKMNLLEEQVKILLFNINIINKIRPQVRQICQLMRISGKNIELILAGKNKKKALGILD